MLENNLFMPNETLAQYVSRLMVETNLSTFDVSRRSHKAISQSQVSRIANAQVMEPGPRILKALAKGLGRPDYEVAAVARGVNPDAVIANERLAAIDLAYQQLSRTEKGKADLFIEMVEREIGRMSSRKSALTTTGIPVGATGSAITQPKTTTQHKRRTA